MRHLLRKNARQSFRGAATVRQRIPPSSPGLALGGGDERSMDACSKDAGSGVLSDEKNQRVDLSDNWDGVNVYAASAHLKIT